MSNQTATIQTVEPVTVGEIRVGNRLRPVSPAAVDNLVASIRELGTLQSEIHVRRMDDHYLLIAGAHRLAAARVLGWDTIPAKVWKCSARWAELMEIDDNLAHAELSPLELATFCAARKRIHLKMHPETDWGGDRSSKRTSSPFASFTTLMSEKRGLSDRHVRRLVRAGEALGPSDINALRAAPRAPTLNDLMAISKIVDDDRRDEAVKAFSAGTVKTIAEAVRPPKSSKVDPVEDAARAMLVAWGRAPMAARRRFIEAIGDDLRKMQDSEPDI